MSTVQGRLPGSSFPSYQADRGGSSRAGVPTGQPHRRSPRPRSQEAAAPAKDQPVSRPADLGTRRDGGGAYAPAPATARPTIAALHHQTWCGLCTQRSVPSPARGYGTLGKVRQKTSHMCRVGVPRTMRRLVDSQSSEQENTSCRQLTHVPTDEAKAHQCDRDLWVLSPESILLYSPGIAVRRPPQLSSRQFSSEPKQD
jgi:hypothetical protein